MKKLILILLFCLFFTYLNATDYYVKNSGNDSNTGLSDEQAWKTISKVNSVTLSPGDVVYFKCGDRWRETLEMAESGNSSSRIKFTKYGTGDNPKIVGSDAATGWTNTSGNLWRTNNTLSVVKNLAYGSADIYFETTEGVKVRGNYQSTTGALAAEYDWTQSSGYVYVYAASTPATRYSSVEIPQRWSCVYLENQQYLHFDGVDFNYSAFTGIDGTTHNDVRDYTGLTVENCEVSCIGGVTPEQYGFGLNVVFSDYIVRNVDFYYCGRRAISMNMQAEADFTVENVLIEKCTFKYGSHTTSLDLTCNNGGSGTAGYNGVIFRYNLIEETNGEVVSYPVNQMWFQQYAGGAVITNVYIYSNVFKYWRENCIATEGVGGNMYIYNNTFFENNSAGGGYNGYSYGLYSDTDRTNFKCYVKNNIFYTTFPTDGSGDGSLIVLYGMTTSHYICDYNLFYRVSTSVRTHLINGSSYYTNTFSSLPSSWEDNSPTPGDPLFTDEPSDLTILTASPAKNAGTDLDVVYDYNQFPFHETTPSIGAFEFGSEPEEEPIPDPISNTITLKGASGKLLKNHNNKLLIK